MLVKLSPYLIAMSIGLIIGVERERRIVRGEQPMGVRSFLLFSLLGAIAGSMDEPLMAFGMVFFAAAATLFGYARATRSPDITLQPIGLTTEIAAMSTFGLGYFCNREPLLSLALGVIMLFVLLNKTFLHTITKERLKPKELQAAATLLLLAVGVIPILPDHVIDPLHIFNPRRLGVIIALIAGLQFLGYAATRVFGQTIGLPLSGFLAGNISSTVAFASYPKMAREDPENSRAIASAATFATLATICKLAMLLFAISWTLSAALIIPLLVIILVSLGLGMALSLSNGNALDERPLGNPLSLRAAIKLGLLLMALIFIVELSQRFLGEAFTQVLTFLAALFELHGVGIAAANMLENGTISLEMAANTIMLAISASFVSKIILTALFGQGLYRRLMISISSGLLVLTLILWGVIKFVPSALIKIVV